MGINSFSNIFAGVAEYPLNGGVVSAHIIEPRSERVTALVWCMSAPASRHDFIKQPSKLMIC